MFAINEGKKKINGESVDTYERDIRETGCRLVAEAGTTGYRGGICRDAGSRTYIRILSMKGDFYFCPVTDGDENMAGVEIAACGDAGLNAVIKALDFIRQALDDQRREVDD